jgi:CubicO group peptidase (beta-lactamase class C family)
MKNLIKFSLGCLFTICLLSCNNTKTNNDVNIYAEFINKMNEKGFNTGNILVYKNGEIVYQNADGLRTINTKDPLTLNSQFRLASVSKQFTGMSIMKLKEAGKLDYDQTVKSILPEFPYDNITVRHLLHHISGLTDYERLLKENWKQEDSTKTYILGNDEIIKEFYKVNPELDFETGEQWKYSNTGYLFLASIIEKVSGRHFRDFVNETIFKPLGMNNSVLYKYQIDSDPNMPNRVFGYEVSLDQGDTVLNDYNIVNDVRGDGGIYSTLEDLYKWNQALVNNTIIPKSYLDEAWTSGVLNNGDSTDYGFGWFIQSKSDDAKIVNHSGGWVGFATFLHNEVDANNGIILLTNNSGESFGATLEGLFNIMDNKPYAMPKYQIEKEMEKTILGGDIDKSISIYHELKFDSIQYSTSEQSINYLGYKLLGGGKTDAAIAIFALNIEEYPMSANTYDSYGDALLIKGDSTNAVKNFKRCFEMDSTMGFVNDKALKLEAVLNLKE